MSPALEFTRRDSTSFPRSIQPPFTIVPISTTSSTPSFSPSFSFDTNTDTGSSSTTTSLSSSTSSESFTSTSFSEVVISISSLSPSTQGFPSTTSSSLSSTTSTTSAAQSLFVPSSSATSTTSPTPSVSFSTPLSTSPSTSFSTPSSSTSVSATTSQTFRVTESDSSPSASMSVPATTTSIVITDGTSTSVVSIPASTASISGKTAAASSSSSSVGFWSNKAAVAGTFTAVAVVALATLAGVILCIRKKRRESHSRNRSITEKFASMDFDNTRPYSTPSEPASHDLSHEPMDAYAMREPVYYPHDPFVANAQNTLYAGSASLPEITYSYAQDVNNQYPYYGNEANNGVPPLIETRSTPALLPQDPRNPFESPDSTPSSNVAVPRETERIPRISPNPFNDSAYRGSPTYQPSVDSFYGASGDGRPF